MSDQAITKECSRCKTEKTLMEFYHHARTVDGFNSWCKSCQRDSEISRKQNGKPAAQSTQMVQEMLALHGIPCVAGRAAGWPSVDLAAWGCVPIEAKGSRLTQAKKWYWAFERHVLDVGILDGVFVFVMIDLSPRYFVVPSSATWLFDDQGRPNRKALSVVPDSNHNKAYVWEILQTYENSLCWIEEARLRASERLRRDAANEVAQYTL